MRGLVFVVSLGTALAAAPAISQAAAGQAKPAAPAAPRPAPPTTAPTAPPAQVQPPAPPPTQTPAPFPTGAKVAYVNLQVIAQLSNDGKAAAGKVNALTQKKQAEIELLYEDIVDLYAEAAKQKQSMLAVLV